MDFNMTEEEMDAFCEAEPSKPPAWFQTLSADEKATVMSLLESCREGELYRLWDLHKNFGLDQNDILDLHLYSSTLPELAYPLKNVKFGEDYPTADKIKELCPVSLGGKDGPGEWQRPCKFDPADYQVRTAPLLRSRRRPGDQLSTLQIPDAKKLCRKGKLSPPTPDPDPKTSRPH
mmetsp:Transcript_33691/g.40703  ORF Transcript_33691/g.40703 Transcript_33691/m.40703 type:complete len:176 (+) Transcript_33691:310-837(+)